MGWLDNYGKEDNYNDSKVSLPEGFVGQGYDVSGRNYSPAWGGQFQNGGNLWKTDKHAYVDSVLQANRNKDFVKRLYTDEYGSIPTPKNIPGSKRGDRSTHLMAYDPGSRRVYPEVVHTNGKLNYMPGDQAWDYADKTGEYIEFPTAEQAQWFASSKDKTAGYKMGTGVFNFPKKQMGGTLPGASGMMYARTIDAAPSNGKYAKKTIASAQSGTNIDYSKLPYDESDIKSFYNKMIGSPWYKQRLINNDYGKKFKKGVDNIIKDRLERVNDASLQNIQKDDGFLNQVYRLATSGEFTKVGSGSYYNPDNKEITMVESQMNREKAHPRTILAHEYGHPETDGWFSDKETKLLQQFNPSPIKKLTEHDKQPSENKADINSLRYNLYKAKSFDPSTGKYNTPSEKFEPSLFEKIKDDAAVKRLRNNYTDDHLIKLINIIADNQNNEFIPIAKNGIIKDDNGYWNPDNWGKVVEIGSNNITMQGVNQPLLGISDEGDIQYMEPGKDYKFKGKKVTEYPIAQSGNKISKNEITNVGKYYTNYLNSPKFKERAINSGYEYENEKKSRLNKLKTTPVMYNESPEYIQKFNRNLGSHYSSEEDRIHFRPDVDRNTINSNINDSINENKDWLGYISDKNKQRIINSYGILNDDDILAHEISHAVQKASNNIKGYTPDKITYQNGMNRKEYQDILTRENKFNKFSDSNKKKILYAGNFGRQEEGVYDSLFDHDSRPSELKADIDAFRYRLKKDGIYDAGKEDFNKDHLHKSKNYFEKARLLKKFSEDDLIHLMNTIAQNNSQELIPIAKNGINNLDQKSLQFIDQLTNFTNYNTKQPGGWLDKY